MSSGVNLCPHFVFIDDSFDFWFGSSNTFDNSFDSFAILSTRTRIGIYAIDFAIF